MLWITGARGLLASALMNQCKIWGKEVLQTGREVDISDLSQVRAVLQKTPQLTHIINCAAFSLVDDAEIKREEAWKTNALGPENLAKAAKEAGIKLVHISTDYVFGGQIHRPLTEEDATGPCNYYGETKLEGEKRALDLSALVIRTSWIFGNGGKNFVAKLLQLLETQEEIRLTVDQWGRATYAVDLAQAILQMLDREGLYQYANQGVVNRYEFALAMREEALRLGYKVQTKSILAVPSSTFSSPCKRPAYSAFDTTKIERYLKIRHWKEALTEFLCEQRPACL